MRDLISSSNTLINSEIQALQKKTLQTSSKYSYKEKFWQMVYNLEMQQTQRRLWSFVSWTACGAQCWPEKCSQRVGDSEIQSSTFLLKWSMKAITILSQCSCFNDMDLPATALGSTICGFQFTVWKKSTSNQDTCPRLKVLEQNLDFKAAAVNKSVTHRGDA